MNGMISNNNINNGIIRNFNKKIQGINIDRN